MKYLIALALLSSVAIAPANAAVRSAPVQNNVMAYMTVGAIVGGVAGGLLCMGHPACIIAGAKLSTIGGAAVGAGFGAVSGGTAAVIVH